MKNFKVTFTETIVKETSFIAENEEEAIERLKEDYAKCRVNAKEVSSKIEFAEAEMRFLL